MRRALAAATKGFAGFAGFAGPAAFAAAPRAPRGLTPNSLHVPGDATLLGTLPSLLLVCIGVATLALVLGSALRPGGKDDR